MRKAVWTIFLVSLLLTACGDPAAIDRAKAHRIERETADESTARAAQEARRQADWEQTRAAINLAKQILFLLLAVAVATSTLLGLLVLVLRWWQASRALVTFAERRAELAARTLRLDPRTLTWPALVQKGALHNLQTGEVYRLGEPKAADPQQVTGDVLIRALGVGTKGAEQIGRGTRDAQAADAIPALAGAVPLVLRPIPPEESQRPGRVPCAGDSTPCAGDSIPSSGDSIPSSGDLTPSAQERRESR